MIARGSFLLVFALTVVSPTTWESSSWQTLFGKEETRTAPKHSVTDTHSCINRKTWQDCEDRDQGCHESSCTKVPNVTAGAAKHDCSTGQLWILLCLLCVCFCLFVCLFVSCFLLLCQVDCALNKEVNDISYFMRLQFNKRCRHIVKAWKENFAISVE